MNPTLTVLAAYWAAKRMSGKKWEGRAQSFAADVLPFPLPPCCWHRRQRKARRGRFAKGALHTGQSQTLTGRELTDDGLPVTIQTRPGAVVLDLRATQLGE